MDLDVQLMAYAWNLAYARELTVDLEPDQWTWHGGPGLENHAAWTIGHLISGSDYLAWDLGLEREMTEDWKDLFERNGPGDPRLPTRELARYPSGQLLLAELTRQHERVAAHWRSLSRAELERDLPWRFHGHFPIRGANAIFMAVNHECLHLGALGAWRRAQGLPSALARMPREL